KEDDIPEDKKNDIISKRILQIMQWNIKKADFNKKWYYILTFFSFLLNISIPVINEFNAERKYITIISALVTFLTGCLAIFNFKDSWYRYRKSTEEIKSECIKCASNLEEYSVENKEAILISKVEEINLQERKVWINTKFKSGEKK
ncbi:MAG: DUF4231 domain-containing protein, partial [Fusobacterium mortiferum]